MLKSFVSFKNITNTCARAFVSDRKCTDCKHFLQSEKSPNTPDLGKCKLFGHKQGNNFALYYANSCRKHWLDVYCGKHGRFFEPS